MQVNLGKNRKILIILLLFITGGLWFYSASAQETNATSDLARPGIEDRLNSFDHLLNIGISAPLTALSLTGATFLTNKGDNDDPVYTKLMQDAKKNLIKAFVVFLACTISLFVFDFLELLTTGSLIIMQIIDLLVSYSLLFTGFANLAIAAKKMYITQAKTNFRGKS